MKTHLKCIAILMAVVLLAAGCSSQSGPLASTVSPEPSAPAAQPSGGGEGGGSGIEAFTTHIQPLAQPVHLNIGATPGVLHDFPAYLAEALGLLEQYGVEAEISYYGNGPLMVEAMRAGDVDCGGYGLGGLLSGSVQGVADILWIRCDEAVLQKFFAANDSAIVQAGVNPETGFYGRAEDWKGLSTYCAPGTTLQYVLGEALGRLNLTFEDLDMVYMDAQNTTTALHAGQGDVWALWNMYGFTSAVMEGYTDICNGQNLSLNLYNGSVSSKQALQDETKKEAVYLWLECEMAVIDWMKASEDNMRLAAEYYAQWCEDEGISTGGADLYQYINSVTFFGLDEQYKMFTEKTADGTLLAEDAVLGAMDFFISQGSYTESDKALLLDGDFNPDFVVQMHQKYN